MRKRALAVAAIALLAAGCGGSRVRSAEPTPASFLAAANRICEQTATPGGRVARLRALHPPASAADLYTHWLRAEEDALAAVVARRKGSKEPGLDPDLLLAIADGKAAGYARRLGADACVKRTIGTMPP